MVIVKDLCKQYDGKMVLDGFGCEWQADDTICLMGKSGQGKTTLLRILAGLEQPDCGAILGIEHKKISMVFQENRLLEGFTVLENLHCVCQNIAQKNHILSMLEKMGLIEWAKKPVGTLSGGMQRRVAIARALLVDFDVLLMDEPFQGLDVHTKQNVIHIIQDMTKDKLVCMSTHHKEEALQMQAKIVEITKK